MLGRLFPTPKSIDMPAFMSDLYRLASAKLFDEAAVHPFAADPERALATGAREAPPAPRGQLGTP